jgi:hypothetical protein
MALIEIDDFPSYKPPFIVEIVHGYVSHNQRVNPHYPLVNNVTYKKLWKITIFNR